MSSVIDAAPLEDVELLGVEVVADRPDHPDLGEEARREAEVDGRAAQHPLALAEGRTHGIERD